MKKSIFIVALTMSVFTAKAQNLPEMITVEGGTFTMGCVDVLGL